MSELRKSSGSFPSFMDTAERKFIEDIKEAIKNSEVTLREEEEKRNNPRSSSTIIRPRPTPISGSSLINLGIPTTDFENLNYPQEKENGSFMNLTENRRISPSPSDNVLIDLDFENKIENLSIDCFDPLQREQTKKLEKFEKDYLSKTSTLTRQTSAYHASGYQGSANLFPVNQYPLHQAPAFQPSSHQASAHTDQLMGDIFDVQYLTKYQNETSSKKSSLLEDTNLDYQKVIEMEKKEMERYSREHNAAITVNLIEASFIFH